MRVRVVVFVERGSRLLPLAKIRVIPTVASGRLADTSDVVLNDRLTRGVTRLCRDLLGDDDSDGRSFSKVRRNYFPSELEAFEEAK